MDPLEWGVIAVMGIAIFIWGPEKVPEIAKTLGNARRDLDAATKQLQGISKELGTSVGTGNLANLGSLDNIIGSLIPNVSEPAPGTLTPEQVAQASQRRGAAVTGGPAQPAAPAVKSGVVSGDRLLVDMARKLGISTHGKTRDDIQNEIIARASQASPESSAAKALETVPNEQAEAAPPAEPQAVAG